MGDDIRRLQLALRDLGHDPRGIDSRDGPRTRAAARDWGNGRPTSTAAAVTVAPAAGPTIYQGQARHPVQEIILHCTATRPDWIAGASTAERVAEIRRWHRAQGWRDIGYHWLIDRDGTLASGRPETTIGAHVAGRNAGTIGISLFGGHGAAATDRFSDHFTLAQERTLRALIDGICGRNRITRISGHNEHAAKACPGFSVPAWLKAH